MLVDFVDCRLDLGVAALEGEVVVAASVCLGLVVVVEAEGTEENGVITGDGKGAGGL
jgi:hypothetical protein